MSCSRLKKILLGMASPTVSEKRAAICLDTGGGYQCFYDSDRVSALNHLCNTLGVSNRHISRCFEEDYFISPNAYQSDTNTVHEDIKIVNQTTRISLTYPKLVYGNVLKVTDSFEYALVNHDGTGKLNPYVNNKGITYGFCTLDVKTISPLHVVEDPSWALLKNSLTPFWIVRPCCQGSGFVVFETTHVDCDFEFPMSLVGRRDRILKGDRFRFGVCVKDGLVVFPYDRLESRLPLKTGECVISSFCPFVQNWCISDVLSPRRILLMCYLSGKFNTVPRGPDLLCGLGSHFVVPSEPLTLLTRANLHRSGVVVLPPSLNKETREKLEQAFVGMSFDFSFYYGGVVINEVKGPRFDVPGISEAPVISQDLALQRPFPERKELRVNKLTKVVTVEDVMRGSFGYGDSRLFRHLFRQPVTQVDMSLFNLTNLSEIFSHFGGPMRHFWKFEDGNLMVKKGASWVRSDPSVLFYSNLYLQMIGLGNYAVVRTAEPGTSLWFIGGYGRPIHYSSYQCVTEEYYSALLIDNFWCLFCSRDWGDVLVCEKYGEITHADIRSLPGGVLGFVGPPCDGDLGYQQCTLRPLIKPYHMAYSASVIINL